TGLFIRAAEREGWYRYHELFRDALLRALHADESRASVAELHRRASGWFAREGYLLEAVRHALAGEAAAEAAELVEEHALALLDRGDWQCGEECLRVLPAAMVQQRPALFVAEAWVAYFRSSFARIPDLLRRAESLLDEHAPALKLQVTDRRDAVRRARAF